MAKYDNNILNVLETFLKSCPNIPDDLGMSFGDRKRVGVCSDLYQTVNIGEEVYEVSVRLVTPFKVLGE